MKKRVMAWLSVAALMVVMLAGALAFTPKVAMAENSGWCWLSGTEIAVTTLCALPALGESSKETRARCEELRASDPNAISSKCKPASAF